MTERLVGGGKSRKPPPGWFSKSLQSSSEITTLKCPHTDTSKMARKKFLCPLDYGLPPLGAEITRR